MVDNPLKFDELHLLPRVIFAMGSIVFVVEVIHENWCMATFGAAIVFASLGVNFFLKILDTNVWKGLTIAQGIVSLLLAVVLVCYAFHLCATTGHAKIFVNIGPLQR